MREIILSEIQIIPVKPQGGLCGFASAVINDSFYIGNIAIYTSPNTSEGYRLVFPIKTLPNGKKVDCFYPINKDVGKIVTQAIVKEYKTLMENFHHIH